MLQLYIVEPQPHLSSLLKTSRDLCVLGSESSAAFMVERSIPCDLMLVSAAFAPMDVSDLVRANQRRHTPTVIADILEDDPTLVTFLEAGAAGYIKQDTSAPDISKTLHAIYAGKPPLATPVGTALLERMHELLALERQRTGELAPAVDVELNELTARERQVLELIRGGASNQDIATELTIELGTVKNHVHNILKKLNVSRRDQAALLLDRVQVADLTQIKS